MSSSIARVSKFRFAPSARRFETLLNSAIAVLFLLGQFVPNASGAITIVDNSGAPTMANGWAGSPGSPGGPVNFSQNFSVTAGTSVLVLDFGFRDNNITSSASLNVRFAGQSMTLAKTTNSVNTSYENSSIYYLINPYSYTGGTGTGAVQITFDNATYEYAVGAFTLSGVDTSIAPIVGGADSAGGGPSVTVSGLNVTTAGSFAIAVDSYRNPPAGLTFTGTSPAVGTTMWTVVPTGTGGNTTQFGAGYLTGLPVGSDSITATVTSGAGSNRNTMSVAIFSPTLGPTWNVDADGNWTTTANWTGLTGSDPSGSSGPDSVAAFGSKITAPRTINLNAPRTINQVSFNNSNKYTLTGSSTLSLDGTTPAVAVAVGSHEMQVPIQLNANSTLSVTASSAAILVSGAISESGSRALSVTGSGTVTLSAGNSYTGGTTVTGKLFATNASGSATGSGAVAVNSGGILGETGRSAATSR